MKAPCNGQQGIARRRFSRSAGKGVEKKLQDIRYANSGDFGYGRSLLDPQSPKLCMRLPSMQAARCCRHSAGGGLGSVRDAELEPARFLALPSNSCRRRATTSRFRAVARIEIAFRRYLDDAPGATPLAPAAGERALGGCATGSRGLLLARAFIELAWSARGACRAEAMD